MAPLWTMEDMKMSVSLFCAIFGIGTLGIPGNFAQAGYGWASAGVILMGIINIYASWALSKSLLAAPKSVKTFGDLGEYTFGCLGRYITNLGQLIVCINVPIMFLVIGGTIFTVLFPMTFPLGTWIFFFAVALLPICLIPTIKEGMGVAVAGALGTLVADALAIGILNVNVGKANLNNATPPSPPFNLNMIAAMFGNLALAYAAGIVIPTLQREHSTPGRMPRVIVVTLGFATVLFMIIGVVGDIKIGCQVPSGPYGNLLFAVATPYMGFISNRGMIIVAMLFMQMHIVVQFGIVIMPAFYIAERFFLRMHQVVIDRSEPANYNDLETPGEPLKPEESRDTLTPVEFPDTSVAEAYKAPGAYWKVALLRTAILAIAMVGAMMGGKEAQPLANFAGASTISLSCMVLPILFYLKVFWQKLGALHKAWALLLFLISAFMMVFGTFVTAKELLKPTVLPMFPYCKKEFQSFIYTNGTHYNKATTAAPAF